MTNKEAVNWLINITADIGKSEHRDLWHYEQALSEIKEMLGRSEPERKKGKWINNSPVTMKCDQCGYAIPDWRRNESNFCPNCGADMRGDDNETD